MAWKLVATNLSDLASKGAEPVGVLLGYTLDNDEDARFIEGLGAALATFGVPLLGGDTVSGNGPAQPRPDCPGPRDFTSRARPARRQGGRCAVDHRPGRERRCSGFEALRDGTATDSTAFRRPVPRLAEGRALAGMVTAMMDVSDGLLIDAARMADASNVTFAIDSASVAFPPRPSRHAPRRGDALGR